ncbi:hypothetical protein P7H06_00085 [Paenibacillus larvae]|nr:hypothetical protein [Paenibacillus larvae]MDT2258289.1 hypothetical protein [Paenibacillus larvae]
MNDDTFARQPQCRVSTGFILSFAEDKHLYKKAELCAAVYTRHCMRVNKYTGTESGPRGWFRKVSETFRQDCARDVIDPVTIGQRKPIVSIPL